ncbi:hypothetical protein GMOD_00009858 [Pyrenophora seminiperda CCB06]|uniref:Secreted protein n=1 Tax=Pyrenophora seminiperda CCB06 TaxID=1302712 RepID=A0A3M7MEK8_9PLEO|nr:hypothetical protein GMOD_00009858 [Pyrenophora seminiperda CCB06]
MKTSTLTTSLSLISTTLAIPCVTQFQYHNNPSNPEGVQQVQICWDTSTSTCRGTATTLVAKPGAANTVNTCTNKNGKINWHLGTGWTIWGKDIYSVDVPVDVSTSSCDVVAYHTAFFRFLGLPVISIITKDSPVGIQSACTF